jgi:hypothetical protein
MKTVRHLEQAIRRAGLSALLIYASLESFALLTSESPFAYLTALAHRPASDWLFRGGLSLIAFGAGFVNGFLDLSPRLLLAGFALWVPLSAAIVIVASTNLLDMLGPSANYYSFAAFVIAAFVILPLLPTLLAWMARRFSRSTKGGPA